jgi:hypothetical protein
MKVVAWSCAVLLLAGSAYAAEPAQAEKPVQAESTNGNLPKVLSEESKQCLQCHKDLNTRYVSAMGGKQAFSRQCWLLRMP